MESFEENYQIFLAKWNKNRMFENVWAAAKTLIVRTYIRREGFQINKYLPYLASKIWEIKPKSRKKSRINKIQNRKIIENIN